MDNIYTPSLHETKKSHLKNGWLEDDEFSFGARNAYLSGAHCQRVPEAFKGAAMLVKERADNAVHQERLKGFLREQGTETQPSKSLENREFLRFENFK